MDYSQNKMDYFTFSIPQAHLLGGMMYLCIKPFRK